MSLALNFLGALFLLDDGHARWTSLHRHHKPQAITIGCDATISMKLIKKCQDIKSLIWKIPIFIIVSEVDLINPRVTSNKYTTTKRMRMYNYNSKYTIVERVCSL
jgi:hypothetical protein